MPVKPAAEILIDEALVRHLLVTQARGIPDAAALPLIFVDEGWDCAVWRLGDALAVRLPRRALAAPLVAGELAYLPAIAERLRVAAVSIPAPLFGGRPDATFPWPWSIVPWFDGDPGLRISRAERSGWAPALAATTDALHAELAGRYPQNAYRGVPLRDRDQSVAERLASQRRSGAVPAAALDRLAVLWDEGIAARPWTDAPRWIHGDLHPGNIIARGSELMALIDFGDLTAGDPAYDLAIAWLAFDADGRERFRDAMTRRYDNATWVRARAWAAAVSLMLLDHSDDNPPYAQLGWECLAELTG